MTLIQGTIASLKSAADIAKSLMDLKSLADVQNKVIDLQHAILDAQSSALESNADQAAMAEEIRTLKEELSRAEKWEEERIRYALVNPWTLGVAYALKESMSNSEPPHLLCTSCYERGRKSILNPSTHKSSFVTYDCPVCKSQIPTGLRGSPKPEYAPG